MTKAISSPWSRTETVAAVRRNAASLERAATLRAAGWKWREIAAEIGRAEKTVRGFPSKYAEAWEEAMRKGENSVRTDLLHKAYGKLEEMLQSDDQAVVDSAVRTIIAHADRRHAINTKRRVELSGRIEHKHATYLDMVCDRLGIDPPVRSN